MLENLSVVKLERLVQVDEAERIGHSRSGRAPYNFTLKGVPLFLIFATIGSSDSS
jgi:hypothetical protein